MLNIDDIYFFDVNNKYISSSELKTSEFSRVRSTSENFYVFNSRDETYLVFTEKNRANFLFILYNIRVFSGSQFLKTQIILVPLGSLRSN